MFENTRNPQRFAGVLEVTTTSTHSRNGGFRVNAKVRKQLRKRKRKLLRRISIIHGAWQSPMIRPSQTKLELAEKQQAIGCGGIAVIMQMINNLQLRRFVNQSAEVFKIQLCSLPIEAAIGLRMKVLRSTSTWRSVSVAKRAFARSFSAATPTFHPPSTWIAGTLTASSSCSVLMHIRTS